MYESRRRASPRLTFSTWDMCVLCRHRSDREYAHTTEEQPLEDLPYIRGTLLYVVVTEVTPHPLFRRQRVEEWCYYAWHPPFYPQRIAGTPPSPHEPCAKPAGRI
ncbi:hypothetical protein J6590_083123 [Homalodisca vitripennis]|nr:hypothetical protein J6590_083123 [Homalodisca vitripennis]